MINGISSQRPIDNPATQGPAAPATPAVTSEQAEPALQPANPKAPEDGEVMIAKDPGGLLDNLGKVLFPTEPPKPDALPTVDTPPSERAPTPWDPTTVRFPTKE